LLGLTLLGLALLGLALLVTACATQELPDGEDVRAIDLTPSAELVLDEVGSDLEVEIAATSVLRIRNAGTEAHRLRGDDFDTGLLEPGDDTLVTFREARTIRWRDDLSDLSGSIVVLPPR
jgi:hypothetical protein